MDSIQLMHAAIWILLGALCLLSIAWGATRMRGRRPPPPFFVVQVAFVLVCTAFGIQAVRVAMLPLEMPAYVDGLLASSESVRPAALTPEALEEFEDARGQVRASVHHVDTTVMPASRTLFVEVTFGNSDVLLMNVVYRDDTPAWLPVSFGPYRLLIKSAVFIPYRPSPRQMIATLPNLEGPA